LVNAIASYDGPTVGGGYCATAVQKALSDAGKPELVGSGNAWDMLGPLEKDGFKPISQQDAKPGDIIVRSWSPENIAAHGGNNWGDISVVVSNQGGTIIQGNDAHYQFEANNSHYGQTVFLRASDSSQPAATANNNNNNTPDRTLASASPHDTHAGASNRHGGDQSSNSTAPHSNPHASDQSSSSKTAHSNPHATDHTASSSSSSSSSSSTHQA
ncbi:MAG: hypothetical protein ACRD3W_01345, partial [Terriglobales bacterium]